MLSVSVTRYLSHKPALIVGFFAFLVFLRWSPPVTTFSRFRPVLFRYIRLRNCADPICDPPPLPMFLHICVTNLNVASELLLLIQTRSELSYYFVSGFVLLPCWKICVCDGNQSILVLLSNYWVPQSLGSGEPNSFSNLIFFCEANLMEHYVCMVL